MSDCRIRLLFVVSSLVFGGAEKHVITLANALDRRRYRLSLAYLKDDTTLLSQIDRSNLEGGVFHCKVSRKIDPASIQILAEHIRRDQRDAAIGYVKAPAVLLRIEARRQALRQHAVLSATVRRSFTFLLTTTSGRITESSMLP